MKKLLEMIQNPKSFLFDSFLGMSAEECIAKNQREYELIIPIRELAPNGDFASVLKYYYIHELFDLSNCYLDENNSPRIFVRISKSKPRSIKTSSFNGYAHPYRDDEDVIDCLSIPDKYKKVFLSYLCLLDGWRNTNSIPVDSDFYEFAKIPFDSFDSTKPIPRYYRKSNAEMRRIIQSSDTKLLSDVASVIGVQVSMDQIFSDKVLSLRKKDLSYPYLPELFTFSSLPTNERIHKGDIIVSHENRRLWVFLIDKESDFELYAPQGYIIRPRAVSPEYLYFYLNSQFAHQIESALLLCDGDWGNVDLMNGIENFPVPIPKQNNDFYEQEFYKIANPNQRYYEKPIKSIAVSGVETYICSEIIELISNAGHEFVKKIIANDLNELTECYKNGAYKATLILAGSILEALLIDWLSELRGEDLFCEEHKLPKRKRSKLPSGKPRIVNGLRVYEQDKNGNYIYEPDKYAELIDYIDEIRDCMCHTWDEEAKMADKIRENRNLVHPKQYIANQEKITQKLCADTIRDLKKIVQSRWK